MYHYLIKHQHYCYNDRIIKNNLPDYYGIPSLRQVLALA